jgi:hypothetical protein
MHPSPAPAVTSALGRHVTDLTRPPVWGVWGGQIVVQGRIITHKRGRGRPRKPVPGYFSDCRSAVRPDSDRSAVGSGPSEVNASR